MSGRIARFLAHSLLAAVIALLLVLAASYLNLSWVREAVNARRWRDKGQLQLRIGEYPSAALVAAIDAVDRGDNARQADDWERRKRDDEARAEQAKRDRENGR